MQKRIVLFGVLIAAAVAIVFLSSGSVKYLKGDVFSDRDIALALFQRADADNNGEVTAREMRVALIAIIRGVILGQSENDINGDGQVSRLDISATTKGYRGILQAVCGNGIPEVPEQCDDGNQSNADSCTNNCTFPRCGNGVIEGNEACDDGDTDNNDGCDGICRIEAGWECTGEPSNCTFPPLVCGDGYKHAFEACDDGNLFDRDLCSSTCGTQTLWSRDIGPITAEEARGTSPNYQGLCAVLFDRGMTGWQLPTMQELQQNRPALLRFGMHGVFWTRDGNTLGDTTNLKTLNLDTGEISVANAFASTLGVSCVKPTTIVTRFCIDTDNSTTPIAEDNVSIYTKGIGGEWSGAELMKTEEDRCISADVLEEVLCISEQQLYLQHRTCTNGCVDGACVQQN